MNDAPTCPLCHSPMTIRTAKTTGKTFWSCTAWKTTGCKGSRSVASTVAEPVARPGWAPVPRGGPPSPGPSDALLEELQRAATLITQAVAILKRRSPELDALISKGLDASVPF
jgi:hypothetical protein